VEAAGLLSLASGLLAIAISTFGMGASGVEYAVMFVAGCLLCAAALGRDMTRMSRARFAILLADLGLVGVTVWVFVASLVAVIGQGAPIDALVRHAATLVIWLTMLGMALVAGVLTFTTKR
jgi:hypothetical protein